MALLLRILGYGWLVLSTVLIVLIYSVLFSARWPIIEDVIGAALILLPGFAAVALAAAVDRRSARRLGRGIAQGRRV
jgi:ABC-type polysaccharide/polyol phosphate export permease